MCEKNILPVTSAIARLTPADIPEIIRLAQIIWRKCYPGIISNEQIEYMLGWMYSPDGIKAEMEKDGIEYYGISYGGAMVGFLSLGVESGGECKLHKLYVLPEMHGKGLGSAAIKLAVSRAKELACKHLILCVNKRNSKAIAAYGKNGFNIRKEIVSEIGGGFVMDDYVMERRTDHEI